MRLLLCCVVSFIVVMGRTSQGAEPEPAALLKQAKEEFEKLPPNFRTRAMMQLGAAECLFGDRELGRKHFAAALTAAKAENDIEDRFSLYRALIESQHTAGLKEDVYGTIGAAFADEQLLPSNQQLLGTVGAYYRSSACDFYAAHGDADSAMRMIDTLRVSDKATPEETVKLQGQRCELLRIELFYFLVRHKKKEQAEQVFRNSLAKSKDPSDLIAIYTLPWFYIGRLEEGRRAVDAILAEKTSDSYTIGDWITRAALACVESGEPDEARKFLAKLRALNLNQPWNEFKILLRLGEFDEALKVADLPERIKNNEPAAKAVRGERRLLFGLQAVIAAKAGKQDLAEKCFAEVDKIDAEDRAQNKRDPAPEGTARIVAMQRGAWRLAGGDLTALIEEADRIGRSTFKFQALLATAIELHQRKSQGRNFFFMPELHLLQLSF